jgi:hypothetical protein
LPLPAPPQTAHKRRPRTTTADIISKFAKATNFVTEHTNQNGLEYPCARKVTPSSLKGNALPGPILIDIKIHDYKLIESGNL